MEHWLQYDSRQLHLQLVVCHTSLQIHQYIFAQLLSLLEIVWAGPFFKPGLSRTKNTLCRQFPNPNCRMQLLKELPVASCHKAIPTCSSTVTGVCIRVCCFWRSGLARLHTYSNIGWATWKCSFHSTSNAWFPKRAWNKFCGCGHAQALFQWCRFSTKRCWCNKYIINFHSELSLGYPWWFFSGAVVICGFQIQPCWWHFERLNCQVLDRE